MQRDGRDFTVEVTADGEGLVGHAGAALLAQVADRTGLTSALSRGLSPVKERRSGHDPGRVVRDLAVMLADGGECVSDLCGLREQLALFGRIASDSTAYRMIERISSEPVLVDGLRAAHAQARARAWGLGVKPERVTIDVDATLITSHSEKDGAAGNFKGGYGFAPIMAYCDESGEALAGMLRPGNSAAHNVCDQIAACEDALAQIPVEHIEEMNILLRCDSAGMAHDLVDWVREGRIAFSVGFDLTEAVRDAILALPETDWIAALDKDGAQRPNGQVAEITHLVDLKNWPERSRLICRRERAHPGAQMSFTDHDGHRFQVLLTDQDDPDIAVLERRQRQRAHAEDHIRNDKDTGLAKLPFKDFQMNQVWLYLVLIAHDLISWTQTLLLDGQLAKAAPQAPALHDPAHRRQARLPRTTRPTQTTTHLALGA